MHEGQKFLEALERKAKLVAPAALSTCKSNDDVCSWLLDPLAKWALKAYDESAFDSAAAGYFMYTMHVVKAQHAYEKNGRYTPESLEELKEAVYGEPGYMVPYMWAAVLIYAFWPSMVDHIEMYRDDFIRKLPGNANLVELACGHGTLGLLALSELPDARLEGLDISASAIEIANRLAVASEFDKRADLRVQDVLSVDAGQGRHDGVIAAMLAEHLENPQLMFDSVARYLAPDGIAFVSTAIESAQRDHIYEFHSESEPVRMAEEAGLRVIKLISGDGPAMKGATFRPRATAMLLRH